MLVSKFKIIFAVSFLFVRLVASSQGICDNTTFEKGSFEVAEDNLCIPNILVISNDTLVKNPRYVFDYQSESYEEVNNLAYSTKNYAYSDIGQPKVYTILQLGEKNGKPSIACKTINVRANNEPIHSYTVCGSLVEFNVPIHSLNDYDSYRIDFGSGNAPIRFQSSQLPFSIKQTLSLPHSYRISGIYKDQKKNCSNSQAFVSISAPSLITNLPYYPNIDRIELVSPNSAKLDYTGPYTNDLTLSASLFRFEKNAPPSSAIELQKDLQPGQYYVSIPDSSKAYCFFVRKNNICNATIEESAELCTHPLNKAVFNPTFIQNELFWESYPTTFKGFNLAPFPLAILSGISFSSSQKLVVRVADSNKSSLSIPTFSNAYYHNPIDCKKKYCYQTEQSITGTFGYVQYRGISVSNEMCIDQSKVLAPPASNLRISTEGGNNVVFVENPDIWPLNKEKWILLKKVGNNYQKIDSVFNLNQSLKDPSIPTRSENYKIIYQDQCNSYSALSDSSSSIYLEHKSPGILTWTSASPFSDYEVGSYELFYLDEQTNIPTFLQSISNANSEASIDFSQFEKEVTFYIKAYSKGNQIPLESFSNDKTISIPIAIYLPDVLTPNSDGNNDILNILGKVNRFQDFRMEIFNRNGELVKVLHNVNETWDGYYKGAKVKAGVYPFNITAITDLGKKYFKNGTFLIINPK